MDHVQVNAELFFVYFCPFLRTLDDPRYSDYLGFVLQLPETLHQPPEEWDTTRVIYLYRFTVFVWPFLNTICVQV